MQLITYFFNTLCTIPYVPLAIYHDSATDAWVPDGDVAHGHWAERHGLGQVRALLLVLIPIRSTSESRETECERERKGEERKRGRSKSLQAVAVCPVRGNGVRVAAGQGHGGAWLQRICGGAAGEQGEGSRSQGEVAVAWLSSSR